MIYLIFGIAIIGLVFGPQLWVRVVMARYGKTIPGMPGTGGELAMHLVERFNLDVNVEATQEGGDHYDPESQTIRLGPSNFHDKSLTAVAVATHEVGHAIQHQRNEPLLRWRSQFAPYARLAERLGVGAFMLMPIITVITRVPHTGLILIGAGLLAMLSAVIFHLLTLPVELDASFGKALPILTEGEYIAPSEEGAVRKVLRAAALTYVSSALADLLSLWRWMIILRH